MSERDSYLERIPAADYAREKRFPVLGRLDFELTERCNNDCIHCTINLSEANPKAAASEMTTREIMDYLGQAAALGFLSVRFTGGEPLLREDFEEIYLFARRRGLRVTIFTNGTRITPRLADLWARIPLLEGIEISVYGMSRASYEAVTRKPGSHAALEEGFRLLRERRVPFYVKGVLLPPNRNDIDAFEAWAADVAGMKMKPTYVSCLDLRARRGPEKRNRLIKRLRLAPEEVIRFYRRREDYLDEMKQFVRRFTRPPGPRLFSCGAGSTGGAIDAYGRFQLCLQLRDPATTFDLRTGSLKDALTVFAPRIRGLEAQNPDYLRRCARCFLKGTCEQCPAKSWMEHGTLDSPVEYLCEVAHAQARDLGLLRAGEKSWDVEDWRERIRLFSEP
jgi:radical SAM protein with 4Fe4S-binding SPASM domain